MTDGTVRTLGMNTRAELVEAFEEDQAGRMGAIPPEIVRA